MIDPAQTVLPKGWLIQLVGERMELSHWQATFKEPFDPVVFTDPDGSSFLTSQEFDSMASAEEVMHRGKALIARLNGAMALLNSTRPIDCGGIVESDGTGTRNISVFLQGMASAVSFGVATAVITSVGPDGLPLPPPPPTPSSAQQLNETAAGNSIIADLLAQFGGADGWYEIYKTIELAEHLAGSKHKLESMLGPSRADCRNMRQTANFYRHARYPRPAHLTTLPDAKSLLKTMVNAALSISRNAATA